MTPACYVIGAAEWNAAVESVGYAFLISLAAVWCMSVDWWRVLDRIRRRRRWFRLRSIRQARAVA